MNSRLIACVDHRNLLAHRDFGEILSGLIVAAENLIERPVGIGLGHQLRLHHALDQGLDGPRVLVDQTGAHAENAIRVMVAVDVAVLSPRTTVPRLVLRDIGAVRLDGGEKIDELDANASTDSGVVSK